MCPSNQVYQECGSSCRSTCRSISEPTSKCTESCIEGCNCPDGLYMNLQGTCVEKSECPCYYNDQWYEPHEGIHREFLSW